MEKKLENIKIIFCEYVRGEVEQGSFLLDMMSELEIEPEHVDKKCDYCGDVAIPVRSTPFLADASAVMCNKCWDMTREEYKGSEGTDIGQFTRKKEQKPV